VILQKKKTFKDLQFFTQSEAMAAILDVGQGSQKSTLSFILIDINCWDSAIPL
jgi:hypothetical protein